jgi:hypothetical protein
MAFGRSIGPTLDNHSSRHCLEDAKVALSADETAHKPPVVTGRQPTEDCDVLEYSGGMSRSGSLSDGRRAHERLRRPGEPPIPNG